ncbi:hypothetical protein OH76DRAFT_1410487 [Lentinus brumalis]|uniref:DUF202 domain-containing protein n=1 Tax=Lentinus brumalis TaxID=2498619 RepID=A0A371CRY3_9APHY|nr:hypothetical protein OH76DRAFT_1410487 [Polyporus brumalis]
MPTLLGRGPPLRLQSRSPSPEPFGASALVTTPAETSRERRDDEHDAYTALKRAAEQKKRRRVPRWREVMKEWGLLLTLENAGSVARDHLASERTFLAYARTSLTISSTGVALVQLFTLSAAATEGHMERFARPLGALMIGLGICTLSIGVMRYFIVQASLIRGVYPVARIGPTMISAILVVTVVVVFVVILTAR